MNRSEGRTQEVRAFGREGLKIHGRRRGARPYPTVDFRAELIDGSFTTSIPTRFTFEMPQGLLPRGPRKAGRFFSSRS